MRVYLSDDSDPQLTPYRNLRDRDLSANYGVFVAEGWEVVSRLLKSSWSVRSLLVVATKEHRLSAMADDLPDTVPVFVVSSTLMTEVVGFEVHRGILALGERRYSEPVLPVSGPSSVLALSGVNNHENVGMAFRNAAALGVSMVALDAQTADPLYRKALRVSMGHVLSVPFRVFPSSEYMVNALREHNFHIYGSSPGRGLSIDQLLKNLGQTAYVNPLNSRITVLIGPEGPGLSETLLNAVDDILTVPMARGTDSLNAATSAAIILHGLRILSPSSFVEYSERNSKIHLN